MGAGDDAANRARLALARLVQCRERVRRVRRGDDGPFFLECMTYRWKEHVGPGEDYALGYRERTEAEPWMHGDQVAKVAAQVEPALRARIEEEVEAEIADAFTFAEKSPFPDDAELYTDVFRETR